MSQINEELRGNKDTHTIQTHLRGMKAHDKTQEEYCRTVRSSVKLSVKLRHQLGLKDHQAGAQARGRSNPKARKTGPLPRCVYRWMLQELLY